MGIWISWIVEDDFPELRYMNKQFVAVLNS